MTKCEVSCPENMFYHSVMLIYGISSLLVFSEDGEPLTVNQKELSDGVGLTSPDAPPGITSGDGFRRITSWEALPSLTTS